MKRGLRAILAVFLLGALLLAGLAFPQFILQSLILPAATVLWLVLRIFVLSFDQQVFWWGVIASAVLTVLAVLLRGSQGSFSSPFFTILPWDPARRWRGAVLSGIRSQPDKDSFRRDLAWLLTWLHASQRPGCANYEIREAFLQRRIPLPESIYVFLFSSTRPPDPVPPLFAHPGACLRLTFESVARTLRRRARRRSGRESSDYLHSIDEVLAYMETSLEMNHELERDS